MSIHGYSIKYLRWKLCAFDVLIARWRTSRSSGNERHFIIQLKSQTLRCTVKVNLIIVSRDIYCLCIPLIYYESCCIIRQYLEILLMTDAVNTITQINIARYTLILYRVYFRYNIRNCVALCNMSHINVDYLVACW